PDYPLGFALNLGDSIVRARYRRLLNPRPELPAPADPDEQARLAASLRYPTFLTPGRAEPIVIRLYPTANVFKKGHRIRVDISSSNYPRFDVNPNTGDPPGTYRRLVPADNTVVHDAPHPSHVI